MVKGSVREVEVDMYNGSSGEGSGISGLLLPDPDPCGLQISALHGLARSFFVIRLNENAME
jgi:hypothetical protein